MSLLSKVIDARGRRGAELQAIASSLTDPECKLSQPEKLAILKQIEEAREAKGLVLSVTARVRNELLHPLIGNPFTQTPPTGQRRPASLRSSDF